ncbi:uncharacterized protein ARMOST_10068 [Armillaria ostoyae]|uniref:Uncharacterized protein n=1 Tax=Armillaria ostoyae TaxID=47428 RepID=A0A284RD92_ARMOS|nr:uncharacterized protein ARMOST_10068 [Armillaria ostoyae]
MAKLNPPALLSMGSMKSATSTSVTMPEMEEFVMPSEEKIFKFKEEQESANLTIDDWCRLLSAVEEEEEAKFSKEDKGKGKAHEHNQGFSSPPLRTQLFAATGATDQSTNWREKNGARGPSGPQDNRGPGGPTGPPELPGGRGPPGNPRGGGSPPDSIYGNYIATIKLEFKIDNIAKWDGNGDTALDWFWEIKELAKLEEYIPQALGKFLPLALERGSDVQKWFLALGMTTQGRMRQDHDSFIQGVWDLFLGDLWLTKIQFKYRMQLF